MNTKIYGCQSEDKIVFEGSISETFKINETGTPTKFTVGEFTLQCGRLLTGDWTFAVIKAPTSNWKHLSLNSMETPYDYTEGIKLNVQKDADISFEDSDFTDRSLIECD